MKGCSVPKKDRKNDPDNTTVSMPYFLNGSAIKAEKGTGNNITTNRRLDSTIPMLKES